MTVRFESAAIIGTGLLGASLGLALKARGLVNTVHGVGRRQPSLDTALERGAIDTAHSDVADAVRDANLVVVCTPAVSVPDVLDRVRATASSGAVVTDVTSTKKSICDHAARTWPSPRRFIGSHPMAGSENFGPEHADENLYQDRYVLLEEGEGLDESARASVCALWEAVGATVVPIDPAEHDRLLARTSHVPHIAAAAVAMLTRGESGVRPFAGGGLRDITRVAAGRPELWRDICLTNAAAVSNTLNDLILTLRRFQDAVDAEDAGGLDALFEDGRKARLETFDDNTETTS